MRYRFAAEFKRIDAGWFLCELCTRRFFVMDNLPMTKEEFIGAVKVSKPHVHFSELTSVHTS
jgi:hypothetical protein